MVSGAVLRSRTKPDKPHQLDPASGPSQLPLAGGEGGDSGGVADDDQRVGRSQYT